MEKQITERFIIKSHKPVPKTYSAYLYRIDITEKDSLEIKHYTGWHSGNIEDIETQKYLHSSKNDKLKIALENASLIVYNVLDYGSNNQMATLERDMLSEVNAINNNSYYNKSNGGGKFCDPKNKDAEDLMELANQIFANVKNGKYKIQFYSKDQIYKIVNSKGNIQVRVEDFDYRHIDVLRGNMIGKTADDYDPIILLMPKNSKDIPRIADGNHSSIGVIKVDTMNGLNAVEIPYEEWSKLDKVSLKHFCMLFNDQPKKPKVPNSLDTAARFVLDMIKSYSLYKTELPLSGKTTATPWYNHEIIAKRLTEQGFNANQRGEITKKVKVLWESENQDNGNFLNFSDGSLRENLRLTVWLRRHINHLMATKNVDKVIKITAGQNIWSQLEKQIFQHSKSSYEVIDCCKKVHVLVFYPQLKYNERHDWIISYERWKYMFKNIISNLDIDIEFLPMTDDKIILPELHEMTEDEKKEDHFGRPV